jgi:protein-S-isoprenylcysteine O-methyltransferase Ste14
MPTQEPGANVANPGFIRPPSVYVVALLIGLGLQYLRPIRLPGGLVAMALGILLVVTGVVIFILTIRAFGSAGTPVPGNEVATAVVRDGPMRFSRNPIYLAFSLVLLGLGVFLQSGWVLIMLIPPIALMHFIVIPREERYMEAKFGAEYATYRASVRRWI